MYLSTWSLHRLFFAGALDVLSMSALGKSLGFTGIEVEDIWFTAPRHTASNLRRSAERSGMSVLIAVSNDFTVKGLKEQVAHTIRFMRMARQIGSDRVRTLVGRRNPVVKEIPHVIEGYRRLLDEAERLDLRLAIENHDALSMNPDILSDVIDELGTDRVGVCLDFGNLDAAERYKAIGRLAPRALMVHAKSYDFNNSGLERTIDFSRCFRLLRRARYNGPVIVEYDGKGDQLLGSLKTKLLIERTTKRP